MLHPATMEVIEWTPSFPKVTTTRCTMPMSSGFACRTIMALSSGAIVLDVSGGTCAKSRRPSEPGAFRLRARWFQNVSGSDGHTVCVCATARPHVPATPHRDHLECLGVLQTTGTDDAHQIASYGTSSGISTCTCEGACLTGMRPIHAARHAN